MTSRPSLRRGDVVLVAFPFTDLTAAKLRPALIVRQVTGDDLVLAFITSRVAGPTGPFECTILPSHRVRRGLAIPRAS